jgi:hypothetical protein
VRAQELVARSERRITYFLVGEHPSLDDARAQEAVFFRRKAMSGRQRHRPAIGHEHAHRKML